MNNIKPILRWQFYYSPSTRFVHWSFVSALYSIPCDSH